MARNWKQVSPAEAKRHPLYGIKGWLMFFLIGRVLGLLMDYGQLDKEARSTGLTISQFLALDENLGTWVSLVFCLQGGVAAALIHAAWYRNPSFRKLGIALLLMSPPLLVFFTFLYDFPGSVSVMFALLPSYLIINLGWAAYLARSRRVRVTFENQVLESELKTAPGPAPAPSPAPVSEFRDARPLEMPTVAPAAARPPASAPARSGPVVSEELWAQALQEFNSPQRRAGLWAKAFAYAQGNEAQAQAHYLKERVQQLAQGRVND